MNFSDITHHITPVILSGGVGSRLWPLSRKGYPKQFLPLFEESSFIQKTAQRFPGTTPLVVCNEEHRFIIAAQMQQIGTDVKIMLEPTPKNTAPAAAVAAYYLMQRNPDALMLVCPSDHIIRNKTEFYKALECAVLAAQQGQLVTIGLKATKPETGYGYIKTGEPLMDGVRKVAQFVEKPDAETAAQYVANGQYYWNAGIFLFKAQRYVEELERLHPEMAKLCKQAVEKQHKDLDFVRLDETAFNAIKGDSIDYAIMEQTDSAAVVPVTDIGWSDIGAFDALWDVRDKDENGNVTDGTVLLDDTQNSFIHAQPKQMIATIGVDNLTIVATRDAILVADKNRSQDTKKIVEYLNKNAAQEAVQHTLVHRPWGTYESIDEGQRYQVKRITVNVGQKLSKQKHYHRAEHWTVVTGTAVVYRDGEEILLTENQSVYLPIGCIHYLENPGKIPLTLIEVQVGPYVGEDDIVRLSDDYGRVKETSDA